MIRVRAYVEGENARPWHTLAEVPYPDRAEVEKLILEEIEAGARGGQIQVGNRMWEWEKV